MSIHYRTEQMFSLDKDSLNFPEYWCSNILHKSLLEVTYIIARS